ncbi:MAG: zinc-dependent metalloprotease [Bacteroidota bacterium]
MRKLSLFFLSCLLCISLVQAQDLSPIAQKVTEAKQEGLTFVRVENLLSETTFTETRRLQERIDASKATFVTYNFAALSASSTLRISVPDVQGALEVELVEVEPHFFDYQVETSDGLRREASTSGRHFQGIISDDPKSLVAISFFQDQMMGIISSPEIGNYNISKLKDSPVHLVFNEKNLNTPLGEFCELNLDNNTLPQFEEELLYESDRNRSSGQCLRLYFETDFDMYTNLGSSVANVENFVTGMFNQVSALYNNESISTEISQIFVWTSADSYSNSLGTAVNQFAAARPIYNGNIANLLMFRNGNGNPNNLANAGGIANGIGGLCSGPFFDPTSHQATSLFPDFEIFPVFSRQVKVVTHEIGHVLGSPHTHNCSWNGNGTALDGCWAPEGSCAQPGLPLGGGTIMSYCDRTLVGIPFANGFGIQPGNLIRNNVNNAGCVGACSCDDLCPVEADFDIVNWSTNSNPCRYKFIGTNVDNPGCNSEYDFEWRIQGVIPVVSTAEEFIYDFSGFTNGTYNVTLTISYSSGTENCEDTIVQPITIGCGINPNPTCPPASSIFIGEAEPCIDYMISYPFNSDIASVTWKYNIHGVAGEQTITTTSGPGPFAVPFSLPAGGNFHNDYLWAIGYVTLTNGNTCRISKSKLLSCPGGGGGGGQKVVLFPNPTSSSFVTKSNTDILITEINVRSIYGSLVSSQRSNKEIDLSGHKAGVYFVEVKFEDGTSEIKKLILEQ